METLVYNDVIRVDPKCGDTFITLYLFDDREMYTQVYVCNNFNATTKCITGPIILVEQIHARELLSDDTHAHFVSREIYQ